MAYQWEDRQITAEELSELDKEDQISVMKEWFYERYEDPVNSCPVDSGEYVYIFGGPYNATETLGDEFSGTVPDEYIEELGEELSADCWGWSGKATEDWYDNHVTPLDILQESLEKMKRLTRSKDSLSPDLQKFQRMMIFSFCITALETYLADVFGKKIFEDEETKQKYLEAEANLKDQKFTYAQVYSIHKKMDAIIRAELKDTTFHNLSRAKKLFQGVLGIDIGNISDLSRYIDKRHHFIHRGGKDKNDNAVDTTVQEINDLIEKIFAFCTTIDRQIEPIDERLDPAILARVEGSMA